jgi:hypothetical protein
VSSALTGCELRVSKEAQTAIHKPGVQTLICLVATCNFEYAGLVGFAAGYTYTGANHPSLGKSGVMGPRYRIAYDTYTLVHPPCI